MSTITIDDVPAEELGARLGREASRFKPKTRFKVILEEIEEKPPLRFYEVALEATRQAEANGLTYDELQKILAEDD